MVKEDIREEQRKKVLAGAFECFYIKGYDAATLDDIVKESGISKGTIYKLFKSKEEIYIELIHQNSDQMMEEIMAIVAEYSTASEKIAALFTEYVSECFQSLKWFLVQSEFELFASRREDLMKLLAEIRFWMLDVVSEIIKDGIKNGEFKQEVDPSLYANLFWSFVDGILTHKIHFPDYPYIPLIEGQRDSFLKKLQI